MDGFCIFDILPGSYIDYSFVIASPTQEPYKNPNNIVQANQQYIISHVLETFFFYGISIWQN